MCERAATPFLKEGFREKKKSVKSIGPKCRNHALAPGPPESAEGRSSDEDEGECFAPLIFYLEIIDFCVKTVLFWSRNASTFIWNHP